MRGPREPCSCFLFSPLRSLPLPSRSAPSLSVRVSMRGCGSRSSFLSFIHCCPEFPCPAKPPSPRFLSYVQLGHLRFLGMIRKCHERRAPWKGSLGVGTCGPCAPAFAPSGSPSPGVWSGLTDLILAHRKQRKGGPSLPRSGDEDCGSHPGCAPSLSLGSLVPEEASCHVAEQPGGKAAADPMGELGSRAPHVRFSRACR